MANKMISELEGLSTTTPGDMFIVQTASGETKKLLYAALCGNLLYNDIRAGNNITLTQEQDSSGVHLRIAASSAPSLYEGAGIDIYNGGNNSYTFSVKLGNNLSINAETGAIDATGGGRAATVDVGTVTTGAAGTDAAVTNSGTTSDAVFNFTIPRGADGQNGSNGQDGDDGYSISAEIIPITGGHRVTISSTNPSVTDETFDVMDGVTTIQTTSVNTTVTLTAANWTGNDAPYTQAVNISGITAESQPLLDISVSDTTATGIEQIKQWGYISKAVTSAGSISFSCYENRPTVDLTVKIKVV